MLLGTQQNASFAQENVEKGARHAQVTLEFILI